MARLFAQPQGSFVGTAVVDGVQRLYTHHRVGHFPLVVNSAQSIHTIRQAWVRNALQLGAFAALLMLSCLGLALLFNRELNCRESTEADLFAEKEHMRLMLKSIGDAVVCTDAQGGITYLNPVARQLTGLEMCDVQNRPIEVLRAMASGRAGSAPVSPLRHALTTGQAVDRSRTTVVHHISKVQVEMEASASSVKSVDVAVLGAVAVLHDATLAAAHEARMQRLAFQMV